MANRPLKALVTGAGALLGQGILRSLAWSTLDVHVTACDPSPLSAGLYWADERCLVPLAREPGYMDALEVILARVRPDIVFVGTDVELLAFAEARDRLERTFGTKVVVSSPRVVEIADDKLETARFLGSKGFRPPRSVDPADRAALESLIDELGFPLIVKPRHGARSVGFAVVRDRHELERACSVDAPVVQEYVDGDEYTAGALSLPTAEDVFTIVMRRDLRDGNTYRAFVEPFEELNAQIVEMAKALAPHGPANFQFRVADDGVARVFEINGRFSGTTPLRARAGFNEVELTIRSLVFGERIRAPKARSMTILRHWEETVVEPDALT